MTVFHNVDEELGIYISKYFLNENYNEFKPLIYSFNSGYSSYGNVEICNIFSDEDYEKIVNEKSFVFFKKQNKYYICNLAKEKYFDVTDFLSSDIDKVFQGKVGVLSRLTFSNYNEIFKIFTNYYPDFSGKKFIFQKDLDRIKEPNYNVTEKDKSLVEVLKSIELNKVNSQIYRTQPFAVTKKSYEKFGNYSSCQKDLSNLLIVLTKYFEKNNNLIIEIPVLSDSSGSFFLQKEKDKKLNVLYLSKDGVLTKDAKIVKYFIEAKFYRYNISFAMNKPNEDLGLDDFKARAFAVNKLKNEKFCPNGENVYSLSFEELVKRAFIPVSSSITAKENSVAIKDLLSVFNDNLKHNNYDSEDEEKDAIKEAFDNFWDFDFKNEIFKENFFTKKRFVFNDNFTIEDVDTKALNFAKEKVFSKKESYSKKWFSYALDGVSNFIIGNFFGKTSKAILTAVVKKNKKELKPEFNKHFLCNVALTALSTYWVLKDDKSKSFLKKTSFFVGFFNGSFEVSKKFFSKNDNKKQNKAVPN